MDVSPQLRRYGTIYYDSQQQILRSCSGEELKLRPQSLKVFLFLAENAGEIISKDKIISKVWKGVFVTDDSLVQCIADIRRTLKDTQHSILQTIPRKGYLLAIPEPAPKTETAGLLPFIGREEELAELESMLDKPDCRLLVVLGLGGVGKSCLSQALKMRLEASHQYQGGVHFVSLASLQNSEQIPDLIASALDISLQGTRAPIEVLAGILHAKQSLLILDNIEHLLPDVELCASLLEACPDLNILITSRFPVHLPGEWIYQLQGLPIVHEADSFSKSSACQLFMQTAQRVKHNFHPDENEKSQILEICRLVAGMPLGIKIAAKWTQHLSCTEIIDEMRHCLSQLNSDDLHDDKPSGLASVLLQSWQMLTEREQRIMQALALFRGDFTRTAAKAVAGAELRDFSELISKSMLSRNTQGRYALHEVMRRYANERRMQHRRQQPSRNFLEYHLDLAQQADADILGSKQFESIKHLESEHANLRECLNFCCKGHPREKRCPDIGEAMVGSLGMFWFLSNHWKEGRDWALRFLNMGSCGSSPSENRAAAMLTAGGLSVLLDDYEIAEEYLKTAAEMAGYFSSNIQQARCFSILGVLRRLQGAYPDAIQHSKQSLKLFETAEDQGGYQFNLGNMGHSLLMDEKYDEAVSTLEHCVRLNQQLGPTMSLPYALVNLGRLHLKLKQLDAAQIYLKQAIEVSDKIGVFLYRAQSLCALGWVEAQLDNFAQAQAFFQKSAADYLHLGDQQGLADTMTGISVVKAQQNELTTAIQFMSVADVLIQTKPIPVAEDYPDLLQDTKLRIKRGVKTEEQAIYRNLGLSSSPEKLFSAL